MKSKIPSSILGGYLYHEISDLNRERVEKILKEDEDIRRELEDMVEFRKFLSKANETPVGEINFKFKRPPSVKKFRITGFYKIAAIFLLFLSITLLLMGIEVSYTPQGFSMRIIPFWMKSEQIDRDKVLAELRRDMIKRDMENRKELNDALWKLYSKIESERMADKIMFRENIIQMRDILLNVADRDGMYNTIYFKSKYKLNNKIPH